MPTPTTCNSQYQQQQLRSLWSIPQPRAVVVSPYINITDSDGNPILLYSKSQLDMRRKVEILKYADKNSQQNGTTQNQSWSRLNTQPSVGLYSQYTLQNMANNPLPTCPAISLAPTLSSASGIPGPPVIIQYDPTVPLYNRNKNVRSYSTLPPVPVYTFNMLTKNEIYFLTAHSETITIDIISDVTKIITITTDTNIGVLTINNSDIVSSYTFTANIPVAIWIKGFVSPQTKSQLGLGEQPITIKIESFIVTVLYNTNVVYTKTYSNTDINGNSIYLQPMTFYLSDLNTEPAYNFYAIQYIGNINTQIALPNCSNYNYSVQISYTYSYAQLPTIIYTTGGIQTGVFSNLSMANQNVQTNCLLLSQPAANYNASSFAKFAVPSAFGLADTS